MLQVAGRPARCTGTDALRSDKAMSELGNAGKQEIGRRMAGHLNALQ